MISDSDKQQIKLAAAAAAAINGTGRMTTVDKFTDANNIHNLASVLTIKTGDGGTARVGAAWFKSAEKVHFVLHAASTRYKMEAFVPYGDVAEFVKGLKFEYDETRRIKAFDGDLQVAAPAYVVSKIKRGFKKRFKIK